MCLSLVPVINDCLVVEVETNTVVGIHAEAIVAGVRCNQFAGPRTEKFLEGTPSAGDTLFQ